MPDQDQSDVWSGEDIVPEQDSIPLGGGGAVPFAMTDRIAQLEAKLREQQDGYVRVLADMDNLRKRTTREIEQSRRFALEGFARDLLSVMDNLDRAIDAIRGTGAGTDRDGTGQAPVAGSVLDGIELTRAELARVFSRYGIVRIEALHQPFDPNFHQAMCSLEDAGWEAGTVVQEMMVGYMLHDRLLRPSMVGVVKQKT
jgi:molecular chaperone GrpE